HQLRGRVGRSDRPSRCYLVVPDHLKRKDADAIKRLKVLLKTTDGFKVAEMDMKLRGPGELLGISQSGYFGFNVANLARSYDREILHRAREDALELLEEDPQLASYPDLKEMLMYRYGNRLDLSSVA
ncbi:MAG TPA: DNA helicase RecG, partial [Aquificaceae bacterium]|nr:DNA helicase RecG [Aquificaceae bacterium]